MTDRHDHDPHAEFRRQAAEHFHRPAEPPRIFRGNSPDAAWSPPPAPESTARPADRFTAGTTYTGRGPQPTPAPPIPQTPQAPPPSSPPPWDGRTAPIPTPHDDARVDIQPSHALWGLTALLLLASLPLGFGWVVLAAGCGAAAYYVQARTLQWPPDLGELLARTRITRSVATATTAHAHQPAAVIPFRPLTFPEIFTGSARVLTRNWPTLVGIPTAILVAFAVALSLVMWIVGAIATASMSASSSLFDTGDAATDLSRMFSGLMGFMIVVTVLAVIVAFPVDALLLGLSVIATGKAVRGEPIRVASVLADAKGRMLAVCRLTLCFYGLFFLFDTIAMTLVFALTLVAFPLGILFMVVVVVASFAVGVMFSLAPIVVIVEERGAIDSLKRAVQLAKPAAPRLIGIHLLWAVCVTPLLLIPGTLVGYVLGGVGALLFLAVALGTLIAYFRTLQMLIYTDLRIRQERLDIELASEWARNVRH